MQDFKTYVVRRLEERRLLHNYLKMPALLTAAPRVYVATNDGVYAINLQTAQFVRLGLENSVVSHVAYRDGQVLATCPVLGTVHKMQEIDPARHPDHKPGAHLITLAPNPLNLTTNYLWCGDARSCSIGTGENGVSQYFVGTEPADVLCSSDGGRSWAGMNSLSQCSTKDEWYFPSPPHKPHVTSIDFAASEEYQPLVIAGIEVGGVVASWDGGQTWEERSSNLCLDVHCIRPDPWDRRRLFAVTGGGNLPGGLYYSAKAGKTWRRIFGYRYCLGLSINPYRKAELMLTAADKPPCVGSYVFHSADGGRNWQNITDSIFEQFSEPEMTKFTPVPLWVPGGVILGTCTGHIIFSDNAACGRWSVLCKLPARVNGLTRNDNLAQTSSVMH